MARVEREALDRWRAHCEDIARYTIPPKEESLSDRLRRIEKLRNNYAAFVDYYFPHYAHVPSADFHVKAANYVLRNPTMRGVFEWARGHAKSTHFDVMIPLWLKAQKKRSFHVMVLVGKSEGSADILLGDLQAELEYNQRYIADFGEQRSSGSWEEGEFVTRDECAFFARGRGQSPRGLRYRDRRPDYIVIDDLDDDELCRSAERVSQLTDWVKEALFGSLDGGRGRFIMVGNLISKNSVLARIGATEGVYRQQVNIWDGRGGVSWAAKWTPEEVQALEQFQGYRSFQKEFMNNPITSGAVFRQDWIRWRKALKWDKYDEIVAYCDPSFKSTSKNDYKAIKVWGKRGVELDCLDAFVRQCSVAEMVRWMYDLHERVPEGATVDYFIEANFLQDMILDDFSAEGERRGYQLPIRADKRKKPDKTQRIEAISPLWERGFVFYDEKKKSDRDMTVSLEQTLAFEKGSRSHDDAPDADEGAIYILQKRTRVESYEPLIGRSTTNSRNIW